MMPPGPGPHQALEKLKEPKPKSIKELPRYLSNIVRKFFSRLFYIFGLVLETRPWIMAVMLLLAILSGVLPVVQAYAGKYLLNALADGFVAATGRGEAPENLWQKTVVLLVVQFACIFAITLTGNISNLVNKISGELVANHVKVKIMAKAKDLDLASYDNPEFYSKLENATREADHRPIQIISSVFNVISSLITLISYFVILANVHPRWAAALVIALSLPGAIVSFIYRKKNVNYMRFRSKDRRKLMYYSEIVTDKDVAKEIRMFGLNDVFVDRYKGVFKHYFAGMKSLFIREGAWNISLALVSGVANCLLFMIIAGQVYKGQIEIGDYSLYTGALNYISSGIASLISTVASIYEGTLFIDNLISFMNEKSLIVPVLDKGIVPERHKGHRIELKNVSFRYPGTDRDVIHNMSTVIEPGDTVVLVGLNGAGKTTLIKLITRLYDPTEGQILLDGRDIKEYDTEALYKLYGIIFQDFGKYAVSVRENISFGQTDREEDMDDVKSAADASSSAQFISKLPKEYDTPLMRYFEPDGTELSIGQWQKLSIARAFYRDSDILILDEPTAALDAIAEQEIYNQFDTLRKDKTTVFVSHRLSSATVASKILVIDNGVLIEEGNHSQLMSAKGRYYELFSTQANRYLGEEKEEKPSAPFMSDGPFPNGMPPKADGKNPPPFGDGKMPPFPGGRPPFPTPDGKTSRPQ